MTRDLEWGVPVPVEGAEGKVLYVWFDAPIGYISNTRELFPDDWEKWWKSGDTRLIHFIGKDNIVLPTNSSTSRATRYPLRATGPYGRTNISRTSPARRT